MALLFVSVVCLVVLYGSVSSEDQLGSRLSHSPTSGWSETEQQRETSVLADGDRPYKRQRRHILASDQHPLDYEFVRGVGYYKYYAKPEIWEQARRICESEGAHLMIVNSDDELRVLRSFLARNLPTPGSTSGTLFHMGYSDHESEGHFVTVLGEPLSASGYNNWKPGEPDNIARGNINTDSDCGCIHNTMLLYDCWCSAVLAFWCEIPL